MMDTIKEQVRDGVKNEWNQSEAHNSMMEDCKRARAGMGQPWTMKNRAFRDGYDRIKWKSA